MILQMLSTFFCFNIAVNIKEPIVLSTNKNIKIYCNEKILKDIFSQTPLLSNDKVLKHQKA